MSDPTTLPDTRTDSQTRQLPPYNVVLLDDDDHSYEYVIKMMRTLFGHNEDRAFKIAQCVDTQGRVVCMTTHKELAELKRDQIHAFGRDVLMAESRGSMSAVIEPAWSGDEPGEGDGPDSGDR